MIVLTPEEMLDLDRRTIAAGTPGSVLMQRAAAGIVEYLARRFDLTRERIAVVAGKGNNGEDGRVAAQLLRDRGVAVEMWPEVTHPTLILDAVLGMGMRGDPRGEALEQIRWINGQGLPVVAVDVPSGLGTGGEHVTARHTVTFAALKPVHVLPPWCDLCGEVHVVDIGTLPAESKLHQLDPPVFSARRRDSHKGDYGHVLVIGGSPGKTGAAAMTGLAALRAGAGLVTVSAPTPYPELMTAGFPPPLDGKDVIAIGPGLGLDHIDLVRDLYATWPGPMVVDADALNSIAGWTLPAAAALRVLTPHPGEFRRLGPLDDRVESARRFAMDHGVVMVLKGYRTAIAHPDGKVFINPTGSPAMAKAGSGDILTGLIAGLLAQPEIANPVHAAVWLHGRCGELGEREKLFTLLATELLDYLPDAIRSAH
jgi:NAD(P)H-hydrate repair Nnr-like enzyme with NAD(P)H-hydrate dehydratase domain/NAD(P)H-hydrate repair Nnr-like enzyme with NAD(P)H-hydrate epimerase domain